MEFIQFYQSQPDIMETVNKPTYQKPMNEMPRIFTDAQQQQQPSLNSAETQHNESFMTNLPAQVSYSWYTVSFDPV